MEWNNYIIPLKRVDLCQNMIGDSLSWFETPINDIVVVEDNYRHIMNLAHDSILVPWFHSIWRSNALPKTILFILLVWKNKILTWDSICKCGFQGPRWCPLCDGNYESVSHPFLFFKSLFRFGLSLYYFLISHS